MSLQTDPATNAELVSNTSEPPAPAPSTPDRSAHRFRPKPNLPLVAAAFVLGVGGTALVMARQRSAPPAATNEAKNDGETAKEDGSKEEKSGETSGAIKLSDEARKTAGIRVETVRAASFVEGLTVPGTVELSPNRSAKITPPAPGKVVRLLANPGDAVRAGQPLAVLDSYEVAQAHAAVRQAEGAIQQARAGVQTARAETEQARASVRQAQAEVVQARTRQASAATALQRQRKLAQAGAFSQAPLLAAQSELSAAQSELLQAQTDQQAHIVVLQRAERLFKEELASRSELETAQLEQRQDTSRTQQAQNRVALAKQTLAREQRVFQGGLLNAREVQTAEAEVRAAQGDVQKALQGVARAQQDVHRAQKGEQAALTMLRGAEDATRAARANLYALEGSGHAAGGGGMLTIAAPISGVITERTANVGETVERTASLMVIENLNTVVVNANIPEQQTGRVRVGQTVTVTVAAFPKRRFSGTVQSLAGRVDEKTRTLPVRCLVENPGNLLRPEMFAQITLGIGARSQALSVPNSALEEDGDNRFAYVETSDGFVRRKVQVGRTTDAAAEVASGLKPGERIAVTGLFTLKSETNKDKLKGDE